MSKYKLDKSAQVVENTNYTMTQEEVCERLNDLEAKLAESEKKVKEYELVIRLDVPVIKQLEQQLAEKEKELRDVNNELIHQENWFKDIKSFNNKRDYAKPIFGQMQEYLNHYKVKDKFEIYCSNCGKREEYEFKDITFDEMTYDIYIQCKNCPRSLNTSYFPDQAVFFYKFIADLGALQRMQDYSLIESYQAQIGMLEAQNQDKISFALEHLEKIRHNILCNEKFYFENLNKYIDEQFDNQIKAIKGEK